MFSIIFLVSACLLFICLSVISCFTLKVYFLMCGVVLSTSCFCCFPFFVIVCSPFISFICALFTSPAPCPYQCLILQLTPEDKIIMNFFFFGQTFPSAIFSRARDFHHTSSYFIQTLVFFRNYKLFLFGKSKRHQFRLEKKNC